RIVLPAAGRAAASKPLPIGCVVATRYEAGSHWQPREGGPAAALMALLADAVRARVAPGPVLKTLARAVERAVLFEGPRGEAESTAAALLAAMDATRVPPTPPRVTTTSESSGPRAPAGAHERADA